MEFFFFKIVYLVGGWCFIYIEDFIGGFYRVYIFMEIDCNGIYVGIDRIYIRI